MNRKSTRRLRRRNFLALLPACALPSLLLGGGTGKRVRKTAAPPSIAYLRGSDHLPDLTAKATELETALGQGDWIPAAALSAGDRRFVATGATVTIRGAVDAAEYATRTSDWTALAIAVDYRPFQAAHVHAWSFENQDVPNMSSESRFLVPIREDRGLQLSFELTRRGESPERFATALAVGPGRRPSLRRGIYLVSVGRTPQAILTVDHANETTSE